MAFDLDDDIDKIAASAAKIGSGDAKDVPRGAVKKPDGRGRPSNADRQKNKRLEAAAKMLNSFFCSTVTMLAGENAKPTSAEKDELDTALKEYLATLDNVEIPPWAVLVGVYSNYVASKFEPPSARQRITLFFQRLYMKARGIKIPKHGEIENV